MTTEEKAKAYDEALERARKMLNMILDNELLGFPDQIREIFPQLRESEDEKVRMALVEYFAPPVPFATVRSIPVQKVRDWLEKQKEQKPSDLSEMMVHKEPCIAPVPTPMVADEQKPAECIDFYDEFYKVYTGPKNILAYVNIFVKKLGYVPIDIHELSACVYYVIKHIEEDTKASQKEQKPSEWSEEDETAFGDLMWCINQAAKSAKDENDMGNIWFAENWVKNRLKSLRPQSKDETYKEKDEAFKLGKHQLAITFMRYLDENRQEGKMCLSNGECEDIDKSFKENDWAKILRYAEKYGKKN